MVEGGGRAGVDADRSWQSYRLPGRQRDRRRPRGEPADRSCSGSPRPSTDVLGWAPGELVGRSAADLVHPDDIGEVMVLAQAISEQSARVQRRAVPHAHQGRPLQADAAARPAGPRHRRAPSSATSSRCRTPVSATTPCVPCRCSARATGCWPASTTRPSCSRRCARPSSPPGATRSSWYGRKVDDAARTVEHAAAAGPATRLRRCHHGHRGTTDRLGRGATGTCIRTGDHPGASRLHRATPPSPPGVRQPRPPGCRSSLCLPGRACTARSTGPSWSTRTEANAFDQRARELFETLASDLGLGLDRLTQHPRAQGEDPRDRGAACPDRRERGALPAARRELLRRRLAGGGGPHAGVGVRLGAPRARLGAGAADRPGSRAPASRRPRDRRRSVSTPRSADDRRGRVPHRVRRRIVALDGVQRPPGRGPGRARRCRGPA